MHWNGHALRREHAHVLRRGLEFEVEGQKKKTRLIWTWEKKVEEELGKRHFADQSRLFKSIRLPLGISQSSHPH